MLPVIAVIRSRPGKENELEAVLNSLLAPTRNEPGCVTYELFKDKADPQVFVFIEAWRSDNDLQSHLATPHIAAAMSRKAELIESLEIRSLKPAD